MTRHDPTLPIRQILDHAREAVGMAAGHSRADLDEDRQLELSLIRLLEVIGEAANRLAPKMRARYGDVPWADIVSMRNRLIHAYDAVDLDIVWKVVTEDLPPLIRSLESDDA